jgi:hypothetical protein
MMSEEKQIIHRALEHYLKTGNTENGQVKATRLPDGKTSFIEQTAGDGRSIMLDEFRVEGKVIWAAYSSRTGMVYLSQPR